MRISVLKWGLRLDTSRTYKKPDSLRVLVRRVLRFEHKARLADYRKVPVRTTQYMSKSWSKVDLLTFHGWEQQETFSQIHPILRSNSPPQNNHEYAVLTLDVAY